tara:strand:- start:4904 stop:5446 length:543 start_codon:yes stop_codon:yes gene_type:complete
MSENTITVTGVIEFDPKDYTKKHKSQGVWKRVAMIKFHRSDLCEYYAWFIKTRYNLPLAKPLRNAHISFINDRGSDTNGKWEEVKKKWNGKKIDVTLSVDPRTNATHWWLLVPEENREEIQAIRKEVGLERPNFGLHMTIGYARNSYDPVEEGVNGVKAKRMNEEHSEYIHRLLKKELIR